MSTNIIVLSIILTTNTVYQYPNGFTRTHRTDTWPYVDSYVFGENTNASTRKAITTCTETTRLSVNGAEHTVSREVWSTERQERKVTLWVLDDAANDEPKDGTVWTICTNTLSAATNSITIESGKLWTNTLLFTPEALQPVDRGPK